MKARRQKKIVEIIRQRVIETQDELAAALREAGFAVTQATVSRDIRELGLIKVPGEGNVSRYAPPGEKPAVWREERLKRLLGQSVQSIDHSENMVVLKTLPGEAQGVASALDQSGWTEVIGTVAGDDTILMIIKPKAQVPDVLKRLRRLTGE
ncbi:arginine repressor [Desulfotomaculum copahuensis]|uniref:Arginine repressor n=1 Tax=Desulfotomaculum copahuensis TaxID=1838280 RepID=A0A1B7LIX5_9FIRM|nr:arginine repressor [Desulfotomaculum copahuensis]OAT86514.1 arginine repressor [Desulfotomaculum copahuensis]